MAESVDQSSNPEHSIDGLVTRIFAQQDTRSTPMVETIARSAVREILSSPAIAEISAGWAAPGSSMLGAAAAAAATGMASWLGDSLGPRGTGSKRIRRKSGPGFEPSDTSRYLITAGQRPDESVILILDPEVDYGKSRRVTTELTPDFEDMIEVMNRLGDNVREVSSSERSESADILASLGPVEAAMLARDMAPEVIVTSMPKMISLCVPKPHVLVRLDQEQSTAGIYCRDAQGRFGITACYHGTGPVGTEVEVGLRKFTVALADPVQDIVFIPLGEDTNIHELAGTGGTVSDRAPGQHERATFEGSTSGEAETVISSHDAGLLRRRASVQLKLQTRPDAQRGDSGSALREKGGKVLAFAFERTAYGEYPEFTDWIWADNALSALGLTPFAND